MLPLPTGRLQWSPWTPDGMLHLGSPACQIQMSEQHWVPREWSNSFLASSALCFDMWSPKAALLHQENHKVSMFYQLPGSPLA